MEPPGGVPPDRDRQLVLRNPATPAAAVGSTSQQLVRLPQCIKPTTLSLETTLPAAQQALSPAASGHSYAAATANTNNANVNVTSASTVTGSGISPALASTATAISATTQAATAFSGSSLSHHHLQHHQQHPHQAAAATINVPHHQHHGSVSGTSHLFGVTGASSHQQTIEKLSRPMAFDKMEALVREMQDQEHGVPVRQQKMFLTSIPYAFMGYDLIEWLMDRLQIEESEALNIANQLCLHGYFFPVNDSKTLTVKDDSSLYRFQTPYYWPWQHKAPDNVEYAIYLAKRSLRNKQRHALEDYEAEALASLHKNLKGKWDFISMQAEEQVRLAKERKKGDKIVGDSQERAYWRVHRPPPGQFTPLEPCPVPSRDRQGLKPNKKKTVDDMQRDVDYLSKSLNRTRMKMSQACESLVVYSETFTEYDFFLQPALPSNPWVTEDIAFWQLNNTFVDIPTEKRVKRWAISIEELVSDPTGLQEFTSFLEKEYSHENIRFWIAVNRLRRSAHSQVARKVNEIFEEFLKPGAPCEINIDGKTMESVLRGLKNPSRFTFDSASEHIYMLLLKKDCYPRFIRSDHYKRMLETGIQPSHKKRFFNFGGVSGAKKKMTAALSSQPNLGDAAKGATGSGSSMMHAPPPGNLSRRRGSDRSLTGSAHELAVIGVNKDAGSKVPHSHSQSNLSEIPYRETPKTKPARLETTVESAATAVVSAVCPWDDPTPAAAPATVATAAAQVKLSICPWEQESEDLPAADAATPAVSATVAAKSNTQRLASTSSDNSDIAERMQRNLGIRHQNTVDSGESGMKRLMPNFTEQRRASVSFTPSRATEYQFGRPSTSTSAMATTTTPSPTVGSQSAGRNNFPPLSMSQQPKGAVTSSSSSSIITKDPPSSSDAEIEDELHKLTLSTQNSEQSAAELPVIATPAPTPTPPPITKITPPPEECAQLPIVTPTEQLRANSPDSATASTPGAVAEEPPNLAVVKEVQIELIETRAYGDNEHAALEQLELVITTPTIHVLEPAAQSVAATSPTISCHEATSDASNIPAEATVEAPEPDAEDVEPYTPAPEELSPTTDEYQEGLQFGADGKDVVYDYDIVDTDRHLGYVPPAPTPAPSMAPLAELDVDTVDDELCELEAEAAAVATAAAVVTTTTAASSEEVRRRRKKRNSEGKKLSSLEEKDRDKDKPCTSGVGNKAQAAGSSSADRNAVCPWEDENVSTSDGTFVKTYATLGYL